MTETPPTPTPPTTCAPGASYHIWTAEERPPSWMPLPDADSELLSCLQCDAWMERSPDGQVAVSRPPAPDTYHHYTTPAGRSWRVEVDGEDGHAGVQVPHRRGTGAVTRDGWACMDAMEVQLPLSPEAVREMGAQIDAQLGEEILCGICLACVGDAQDDLDARDLLARHHAASPRCEAAAAAR